MPDVELGVNDITRMGLEVVGRHDILPCPTEQWIRYEDVQFHPIIDRKAFEKNDHIISFKPPDATYLELMRFRMRPPKARELPMQARCVFQTSGNKVSFLEGGKAFGVVFPYYLVNFALQYNTLSRGYTNTLWLLTIYPLGPFST